MQERIPPFAKTCAKLGPPMKRPAGLLLALIALGGLAALQLLFTAGMAAVAIFAPRTMPPGQFSPGVLAALFGAMALFFGLIAAWSITTLVGLTLLRSWARISVLILGGCVAAFSALSAATTLASHAMMPAMPPPAPGGSDPGKILLLVTLAMTGFYVLLTAIGIWWLIYFNLRSTRDLFAGALRLDPETGHPIVPTPGRFSHVPTPILVLGCFYLAATVCGPVMALLPFPAFLFGFIVERPAAPVVFLGIAVLSALVGAGLLRLDPRARIGALVMAAFGLVNISLSLLPWYQAKMQLYTLRITQTMHLPQPPPGQVLPNPYLMQSFGAIVGLLITAYFVWALMRYRSAFEPRIPTPPPPPLELPVD